MSDSTAVETPVAEALPVVPVDCVIEITIRSNRPNLGKTMIASRLMRVLKSEFAVDHVFCDNAEDDIQSATYLLNTQGPPALSGVTVLIVDDNGAIDPKTIKTLVEDAPASYSQRLRALPPIDAAGATDDQADPSNGTV